MSCIHVLINTVDMEDYLSYFILPTAYLWALLATRWWGGSEEIRGAGVFKTEVQSMHHSCVHNWEDLSASRRTLYIICITFTLNTESNHHTQHVQTLESISCHKHKCICKVMCSIIYGKYSTVISLNSNSQSHLQDIYQHVYIDCNEETLIMDASFCKMSLLQARINHLRILLILLLLFLPLYTRDLFILNYIQVYSQAKVNTNFTTKVDSLHTWVIYRYVHH